MPDVTQSARALYRRLIGARPPEAHPGTPAAAEGAAVLVLLEQKIAGPLPADSAGLALTGRSGLATALGLAAGGERAAAFLDGASLARSGDLLARAGRDRIALVVHATLADHRALEAARTAGALVLVAGDVQEAADLTLIARRVAEDALLPAVVAVDAAETAASVQDLLLPSEATIARFLGRPGDRVHPRTAAQEMLFGRHRRRLARWHDPERPMATGGPRSGAVEALAAAGRRAYLDAPVAELLEAACETWASETGRRLDAVSLRGSEKARSGGLVLVAQGAAIATAAAVAAGFGKGDPKTGVIGVRALRPFPAERLAALLERAESVAVLERDEARLAGGGDGDGPLATAVRRALEGRAAAPRITSLVYGLGGAALAPADLAAACRELARPEGAGAGSTVFLGVSFDAPVGHGAGSFPKRQVLLDGLRPLREAHPEAARGVCAPELAGTAADLRPEGAISVAFHRFAGQAVPPAKGGSGLATAAAILLHEVAGGRVRTRDLAGLHTADAGATTWGERTSERLLWVPGDPGQGSDGPPDLGEGAPVDVAIWGAPGRPPGPELAARLATGAAVLVPSTGGDRIDWWTALPPALREAAEAGSATLYSLEIEPSDDDRGDFPDLEDLLGGALFGVLGAQERLSVRARKLLDAYRGFLESALEAGAETPMVERRLSAFQAGLDRVHPVPVAGLSVRRRPAPEADEIPAAVRRRGSASAAATVDSLPRFWDHVGVLYRRNRQDELTPDPYLAAGALPALSGALREVAPARAELPVFQPEACTGCGACWTGCPDGALAPVVIGASALLDQGMALAKRRGASPDALRMAAGKLAAELNRLLGKEVAASGTGGGPVGPFLRAAFETTMAKMPLPEERKVAVAEAFEAVVTEIGEIPVARTAPFFDLPEAEDGGSGELFVLAVDPDACKGCGLCVAECEPGALSMAADSPVRSRDARRLWRLAAELPAPSAETVERARGHADVGALAGALLPAASRAPLGASHGAEAGSGEAIAVRQALGAVAFHRAPEAQAVIAGLDALREELAEAIHGGLARALPDRDLAALAQGLGALERPDADLAELTRRVEGVLRPEDAAAGDERVDVARLRRLVDAARAVADLRLRLGGPDAAGEALPETAIGPNLGLGVVLGPRAAAWGAWFPYDAFSVPVTADATGDAVALARGLAEGRVREALAAARVTRRARIELGAKGPAERARADAQVEALAGLSWEDLTADERRVPGPLVLVVSEAELAGELGELTGLLAADRPIAVLALTVEATEEGAGSPLEAVLPAWAISRSLPGATLAQGSVGHPDLLDGAVAAALAACGPALLRVLAPSPGAGGFSPSETVERARAAVASRRFPLFLRPAADEDGSPAGLDLSGNPPAEPAEAPEASPALWSALERAASAGEAFAAEAAARAEEGRVERLEEDHRREVAELRAGYEARIQQLELGGRIELARQVRSRLLALAQRPATPAVEAAPNGQGEGA